jgi:hypothetical protein
MRLIKWTSEVTSQLWDHASSTWCASSLENINHFAPDYQP